MYNKLFTKILDSSIWLRSSDTRIVWVTLLAAMDEDGFVQIATSSNLARRANVTDDACNDALVILESPEIETAHDDDDGRRIERVPGGWVVLNAKKYQDMTTRNTVKESSRERVRRFRERKREAERNACNVTGNGLKRNQTQTQPQTINTPTVVVEPSIARQEPSDDVPKESEAKVSAPPVDPIEAIYQAYPRKVGKRKALESIARAIDRIMAGERGEKEPMRIVGQRWLYAVVKEYANSPAGNLGTKTPHPATWFNQSRYLDDPNEWQHQEETRGLTKRQLTEQNLATSRELIRELGQARGDSSSPQPALGLLPAASGPQPRNAIEIHPAHERPEPRAVGDSVRPGGTGNRLLPVSGSAPQTGRMPDRRPTF